MRQYWKAAQQWAHAHHRAFHHAHNGTHMTYLGLVFAHGPYSYAAGALLLLTVIMYALKLESEQ